MPKEQVQDKSKSRPSYKTQDGKIVPSVTTILGDVLSKPALIKWAWGLGMRGVDLDSYLADLSEVGKLAHAMILAHFKNQILSTDEHPKSVIDRAETCVIKFFEWSGNHDLDPIMVENPLVSETNKFGGTPDFYGMVDNIPTLLDFKTGKGIYQEYFYQLGAYNLLLKEHDMHPERFRILRIGRLPEEGFEEKQISSGGLEIEGEIFLHALAIYNLKKRKGK